MLCVQPLQVPVSRQSLRWLGPVLHSNPVPGRLFPLKQDGRQADEMNYRIAQHEEISKLQPSPRSSDSAAWVSPMTHSLGVGSMAVICQGGRVTGKLEGGGLLMRNSPFF